MLKTTPGLFPARSRHVGMHWGVRAFLLLFLCILLVWTDIFSGWTATPAHAATQPDPNPPLTAPSWLQPPTPVNPPDLGIYTTNQQNTTPDPIPHAQVKMPDPVTVPLTTSAQQVLSQDSIFEVDVAADSVSASQIQAAGGTINLKVSQMAAMSGGGSSGKVDLGTYQVDFLDAQGNLITDLALAHPFTFRYHLPQAQQSWLWQDQKIDAIWQPSASAQSALKAASKTAASPAPVSPQLLVAQKDPASPVWSVSTNLSAPSTTPANVPAVRAKPMGVSVVATVTPTADATSTPSVTATPSTDVTPTPSADVTPTPTIAATSTPSADVTPTPTISATPTVTPIPTASVTPTPTSSPVPAVALASSSIAFSTETPTASWGKTKDVDVGLSSGSLTDSYPLSLPPGPGGLTPPLNLSYSSGSVNESHNAQGASSWVGQGWNMSLGSISWSQQNVTSGLGTTTLESSWNINDPNGLSGQLIPPDIKASTNGTLVPSMGSLPLQYIWHTAPESHAKIQEVNFNGQPCWHVWLPNGTIEEFGCVDEARQTAIDTNGVRNTYRWDLNLIVDRYGNQIRIHYQRNYPAGGSVRDAQISSVEYDDLSCHNIPFNGATAECSSWHPLIKIIFDASMKPARLTNATGCQNWTSTAYRCDDPVDLSSSKGLPIANALTTYVLNDLQVQVNGHVLRRYNFSYNQGGPQTITEVYSGQKESVAGYLTLTKIQQLGTDGVTLNAPVTTMGYVQQTQHYLDIKTGANAMPSTNCGPAWTPRDGNGCFRWQQSYNSYYLSTVDNGMGWHAQMTWQEGHSNTHGVDSSAANNPFTCNGKQTITNWCGEADDMNWSRIVLTQRVELNNGVNSTWKYQYYLNGLSSKPCATCAWGNTWGNQNDVDAADYYNGQFTSYAETVVTNPDSTSQINYFASTPGWGLASSGITCYVPGGNCNVTPYWNEDPAAAGRLKTQENFDARGALMQVTQNQYMMNCPPAGVAGSQNAAGAPYDPGNHYLFSELDKNNPVVVCDPRISQQDTYQVDGVTNLAGYQGDARVVHKTVKTSYDGDNRGVGGYDYGNVNSVDTTSNDVGGFHFIQNTAYYPNDNINGLVYLTDLPAFVTNQDGAGTYFGCSAMVYGNNASAPHAPNVPSVSQQIGYPNQSGGCAPPTISTQHAYNNSGNPIAATDADGHQGCTMNGAQYSACASYDGFQTHLTQALNAKNQAANYHYDTGLASGGYGQWLLASSDANGQMTSYSYDVLGRLTSVVQPGDTASAPTTSYVYTNTCTVGITVPCLRLDTVTRVNGASTTTTRQWFDGMGRLVQTQTPGPNASANVLVTYTIYDDLGRPTDQSLPYAIANPSNAYVTPDRNQARTATRYDGLGRPLGSISYGPNAKIFTQSTITYTVARGIASFNVDTGTAFEQTITLDAYGHQSVQYTDALGRDRYEQVFDGTSSPYSVVRTVQYNRDEVGNVTSVITYDSASTALARTNATYDGLQRRTGYNDSDLGACNLTPMPPSCSNSSDTAWSYSYDGNGNVLSQTDPRNVSTYTSYDVLDRPLCRGTAANQVNPCQSSAYTTYFYDGYTNSSNPNEAFPIGCSAPSGSSDPVGRATVETFSSSAGSGWRCYGYDTRGQTTSSGLSVTADGQTTTQTALMSYNDAGAVTSLTYPDGEVLSSNYDNAGYLRSLYFGDTSSSDPVSFLSGQVSYTNTGQLAGLDIGGSGAKASVPTPVFSTTLGYDGIQRPISSSATLTGASTPLWSLTRTLDNVGNMLQTTSTVPTTTGSSVTDTQSFCYDALNRLTWAGNNGTTLGGDHCGSAPTGSTTPRYSHVYAYDAADRMISGDSGTLTYTDAAHSHAATYVSSIPNQYASYDVMGNMTCRTTDTTGGQSCAAGVQTGAQLSYDNLGRLASWTGANGLQSSEQYLYDNEGNRVLRHDSTTSGTTTTTDTITFDGLTDVSLVNGAAPTITNYYSVAGQRVAMRKGAILSYLLPDFLGSDSIALNSDGTVQAVQLFAPYGAVRYSDQVMPTDYNFTGQRLDSMTGLIYDNARYYDPVSGRFTRADTVQTNTTGMDPYAYVGNNPESRTDPSGNRVVCGDPGESCDSGSTGPSSGCGPCHDPNKPWPKPANGGGGSSPTQDPQPSNPAVQQVVQTLTNVAGFAGKILWEAIDLVFNVSGMYHDIQTLTDANANGWARAWALGDLTASVIMDINMLDGAGEAMQAARIGAQIAEKGAIDVSEMAGKDAAKVVEGCIEGGLSFIFATKVATQQGEQAIGTLKVGAKVWAYNPSTRKMELQPILHVWINHDNDLIDLSITKTIKQGKTTKPVSEVIHTNQKHPFLTVEKGFLPVGKIKLGMHVVEASGQVGMVSGWKVVPGVKVMYNLEVAHDHTFVVGVGMWVVHNCGGDNFVKDADGKLRGVSDPSNAVPGEPNLYTGRQTDPASHWKLSGQNVAPPKSNDFFDFLRRNGKSTAGWQYVMREYDTPLGPGKDHFWWDGGAGFFHHD